MGQVQAPPLPPVDDDQDHVKRVKEFCAASKGKVGIQAFLFQQGDESHVITSEVTDDNNVLDVEYRLWKPQGTDWTPVHTFSSGRVAAVAVYALLRSGFTMAPFIARPTSAV